MLKQVRRKKLRKLPLIISLKSQRDHLAEVPKVNSIDELFSGDMYDKDIKDTRSDRSEVVVGSNLMAALIRHNLFETMKYCMGSPEYNTLISKENKKDLKDKVKTHMGHELLIKVAKSQFYRDLKDIGSKKKTYDERMYDEVMNFCQDIK